MKCVKTVNLFEPPVKNRRKNPKEWADELLLAAAFKRPPTPMLLDPPFYPWLPITPLVNFDLNYQ